MLEISPDAVGVKAKTPEGMGTENAAIAHVVVLLQRKERRNRERLETAEAVPQPVVDDVVEQMLETSEPRQRKKK